MAAVNIEGIAFHDVRFSVLASRCGLADSAHALGKMAFIWKECTDRYAYVLPELIVNAILGPNGANGIVEAELGERADGGIRIRGTVDRIEWLQRCRINGGKGNAARRKVVEPGLFDEKPEPEVQEAESAPKRKVFVPPTVEEVREYCAGRANQVDADNFVAFYESKGWMIGKNKMVDWKKSVITWEKRAANEARPSGKGTAKVQQSTDYAAETLRKIMEEQTCQQPSQPNQQQRLPPPSQG